MNIGDVPWQRTLVDASEFLAAIDARGAGSRLHCPRHPDGINLAVRAMEGLAEVKLGCGCGAPDLLAELGLAAPVREATDTATTPAQVRDRFPALDLTSLLDPNRPAREWVVAGLIPAAASVSLVAPAGVGKSLLALNLAISVAEGRSQFSGLRIPHARRVLYLDLENTEDDLAERFRAFGYRQQDRLERLTFLPFPDLAPLDTAAGGAELAAIITAYKIGPGDLIVLDSFQRVISGPENDADTLRAWYRHTGLPLKRAGVTVLRLDNTGKEAKKGSRGSSGKRDDVDIQLILTADGAEPDGSSRRLRIEPDKSRLAGVTALVLVQHTDDDTGRVWFSSPSRDAVDDAIATLAELDVPADASQRTCQERLNKAGRKFIRETVRQAVKERKEVRRAPTAHSAPQLDGAPWRTPADSTPET